jgi:1-acyl-sn-glycerol-3-phosphate acyltransferase
LTEQILSLAEINLDDLVNSFGWQSSPRLAGSLRRVFHRAALKFARQMIALDSLVGAHNLTEGSRRALPRYVRDVCIFGKENLPDSGPILILSNHPGMTDTLCLFAAVQRPDLRIIALNRPFLQSLPHISRHLFYVSEDSSDRLRAVRQAASHLRGGGAVLTFPAGRIEPDPNVYGGALGALDTWTDSAGVFLRFAPQTQIIAALVRGVLWDKAVCHPLTRLKRSPAEREKLGAAFQLLMQILFNTRPVTVRVQFGKPLGLDEIGSTDMRAIHAAVLERMRGLISNPPRGEGESAL